MRDLISRYRNLLLYGVFGGTSAGLDFLSYTALVTFTSMPPAIATAIGVTLGIGVSFALNATFNFRTRDRLWRRWWMFFSIGLVGLGLSVVLVWLMADVLAWHPVIAKLVSIPPVVLAQYAANRRFSFAVFDEPTPVTEEATP